MALLISESNMIDLIQLLLATTLGILTFFWFDKAIFLTLRERRYLKFNCLILVMAMLFVVICLSGAAFVVNLVLTN